jgi:hypothetical protein
LLFHFCHVPTSVDLFPCSFDRLGASNKLKDVGHGYSLLGSQTGSHRPYLSKRRLEKVASRLVTVAFCIHINSNSLLPNPQQGSTPNSVSPRSLSYLRSMHRTIESHSLLTEIHGHEVVVFSFLFDNDLSIFKSR